MPKLKVDPYKLPDDEKIMLVDEALNHPDCTIPPEVIRSWTRTREQKLDLFDKLVVSGIITWKDTNATFTHPSDYQPKKE